MTQITPEQLAHKMAEAFPLYKLAGMDIRELYAEQLLPYAKIALSELAPKIGDDVKGAIEREYPLDTSDNAQMNNPIIIEPLRKAAEFGFTLGVQNSREKAIEFGDWINSKQYIASLSHSDKWISTTYLGYTTSELYDLFTQNTEK